MWALAPGTCPLVATSCPFFPTNPIRQTLPGAVPQQVVPGAPSPSRGFLPTGVPSDRSSSLGWNRGPPRQVFVVGGEPESPATGLRRWGGRKTARHEFLVRHSNYGIALVAALRH